MNYAKNIGRVGGLAVALGIGAAVVTMPTAGADEAAPGAAASSETTSSSSLTSAEQPRSHTATTKLGSRGADPQDSEDSDESVTDAPSADPDESTQVSDDAESDTVAESADDPRVTIPEDAAVPDDGQSDGVVDPHVETPRGTDADRDVADVDDAVTETPAATEVVETIGKDVDASDQKAAAPAATEVVETGTVSESTVAPTAPNTDAGVVTNAPKTLSDVVDSVMKAIFGPFANPFPTTPDSSPLLLMLEWFRQTTVGAFYNRNPEGDPLQIGETAEGTVVGTVGAIDPDGDPLTYEVAQGPKFGTIVMNADGTYVYTPGTLLARDGGEDTFVVTVRDSGIRLLSRPGVHTVSVSVTVGAGDELGIGGSPYGMAMSPDRRLAYVTDIDNHRVVVVDVATGSVIDSIKVGAAPYGITVARDGRAYVVNSDDGTLSVIDTATNTLLPQKIYVGNSPTSVAVNASGTRVVVTASNDDSVSIIDTATMKVTRVAVGDGAFGVAIKDSRAYVTNEFDDTVSVIDLNANTVVATIAVGNAPAGIAAGGNRLVVTNSGSMSATGDGTVTIIDLDTLTVVGEPVSVGEMPTAVVVDAEGKFAYVTDAGYGTVTVLDLTAGRIVGPVLETALGATGIDIGFDGRLYVAGTHSGTVDVVSPASAAVGAILAAGEVRPPTTVGKAQMSMLAAADASPNNATWTRTFEVHNLTTDPVTMIRYEGDDRPVETVPLGYVLAPGGVLRFEVPMYYWSRVAVRPVFENMNTGDTWSVRLNTNFDWVYAQDSVYVRHSGGTGTSFPSPEDWIPTLGNKVSLLEKRDNVITIEPGNAKATEWVNKLCNGGGTSVRCVAGNITKVRDDLDNWSEWQLGTVSGGPSVDNNFTSSPHEYTGEITASWATKTSIEASVKLSLSLSKVLGADLSAKLGKDVTNSATYKGTVKYVTPPWKKITVLVRMPVVTITSDLFITIGNTTVIVKGVTYDVPNPSKGAVLGQTTRESEATDPFA